MMAQMAVHPLVSCLWTNSSWSFRDSSRFRNAEWMAVWVVRKMEEEGKGEPEAVSGECQVSLATEQKWIARVEPFF